MKYIAVVLSLIFSVCAFASSSSDGKISRLHFMDDGVVLFTHIGTRVSATNDKDCVTSQPTGWGMDAGTDDGKIQLSGLLAAFSMGLQITVVGTADCNPDVHLSRETVKYFYIQ